MNNYGKLFDDELINFMIDEARFKQQQWQITIYYKYAPYGSKLVVLSYIDDCVFCYTYEELGKWFVDTLGKKFHVNFLGYANWFMSIRLSQLKEYSTPVDQARYATAVVSKYLDTDAVKEYSKFPKTNLPHDVILLIHN